MCNGAPSNSQMCLSAHVSLQGTLDDNECVLQFCVVIRSYSESFRCDARKLNKVRIYRREDKRGYLHKRSYSCQ